MTRTVLALSLALAALAHGTVGADEGCTLVFSAYPGEIDALLTAASLEEPVVADGVAFYPGTLDGNDVVLALSGIGLENAEHAARTALDTFTCIDAIVFSGVAGGAWIGDVVVPDRWTIDDGQTSVEVEDDLLTIATGLDVDLTNEVPAGDLACVGVDPRAATVLTLEHQPELHVGGYGKSADPFGGRSFPCVPGGGDVFGCSPCRGPLMAPDAERFITRAAPFIDPDFFFGYFEQPPPASTDWDAEDMETAAVATVAAEAGIPFIAFRGVSDGAGDPLQLPGFPFQFFVYRQIAADNAAAVARAFLAELG